MQTSAQGQNFMPRQVLKLKFVFPSRITMILATRPVMNVKCTVIYRFLKSCKELGCANFSSGTSSPATSDPEAEILFPFSDHYDLSPSRKVCWGLLYVPTQCFSSRCINVEAEKNQKLTMYVHINYSTYTIYVYVHQYRDS